MILLDDETTPAQPAPQSPVDPFAPPATGPTLFAPPGATPTWSYLVLDIETDNGSPEDALRWMQDEWRPNRSHAPHTIGKRFLEALDEQDARLALLDTAPVALIALQPSGGDLPIVLHCLGSEHRADERAVVHGFTDARTMLVGFRAYLETRVDEYTTFVGHNIIAFDLRRLRWQFLHHGLRLPRCLVEREQPVFDLMREYGHAFTAKGTAWVSLDDIERDLGLPRHKDKTDGSQVPALIAAGRIDELIGYALTDVAVEHHIFLRMTGQEGA